MRRTLLSLVLVVGLVSQVWARSEKTLAYPREAVWPTTVRFLVVDENAKVIEKDADAGYVLFEIRDEGKLYRGSLEVLTIKVDGRSSVRFVISIPDRPSWMEIAMLQRLERKLRSELGSPNTAPTPKPKDPPKDAPPKDAPPKDNDAPKNKDAPNHDPYEGGPPVSPTP